MPLVESSDIDLISLLFLESDIRTHAFLGCGCSMVDIFRNRWLIGRGALYIQVLFYCVKLDVKLHV